MIPTTNCKFELADNIQSALTKSEKITVNVIKSHCRNRVAWFCTVNRREYVDILEKHFTPIYIKEVPVGYNGGMQYHCLFRGGMSTYNARLDKMKKTPPEELTDKHLTKIMKYKSKAWLKKYLKSLWNS